MKKMLSLFLCAVLLMSLTACGGSAKSEAMYSAGVRVEEAAPEAPAMMADKAAGINSTSSDSTPLPENRKWIITMDMNVETDDLEVLMSGLEQKIQALGGYVEDQSIHNGSNYSARRYRNANITVRIPDEQVEQFTGDIAGMANVVSQNLRREDITLKYVATASRVTALETEEARLLELLAKAETMADLLEIEARLTDVRYELENYASQLRLYDNQVDYATVYLSISEVQEYTPVEEPTFFERIKNTFTDALKGLGDGIVNITVFLVGNSPYLLTFGVLVFVILKLRGKWKFRKIGFRRKDSHKDQAKE